MGGDLYTVTKLEKSKRAASVPPPARGEERRRHHGLLENVLHGIGMEEVEDVGEWEAVLLAERNIQAIVAGGGLQLEIEGAAETLANRQPPGLVDPTAKGTLNSDLHPTPLPRNAPPLHRP